MKMMPLQARSAMICRKDWTFKLGAPSVLGLFWLVKWVVETHWCWHLHKLDSGPCTLSTQSVLCFLLSRSLYWRSAAEGHITCFPPPMASGCIWPVETSQNKWFGEERGNAAPSFLFYPGTLILVKAAALWHNGSYQLLVVPAFAEAKWALPLVFSGPGPLSVSISLSGSPQPLS